MARFGQALAPLAIAQPSACFAIIGGTNCFYWASKLLHGTFWPGLKTLKSPQQLSKASAPHNPPLALPSYLPIGPSNCFYWASKLLHGTFWPGLKVICFPQFQTSKPAPLAIAQPSACFAIAPPHRRYKTVSIGLRKLLHGTFWPGLKTFKSPRSSFRKLQHRTTLRLLCHRTSP